ncbi:MAG: citramalate synthase [Oscillospiraceae bacterium]
MNLVKIFDSTLRDGAQAENISFTLQDKILIAKKLDKLSISYIEAGNPASNPKDMEFFNHAHELKLENAKLVAFGATRRRDTNIEEDQNILALLKSNAEVVSIFGKTSEMQVTEILNTTLDENLAMIYDTIKFFKDHQKEVIFDAEHFFDGYKSASGYAIKCLETAQKAGADTIVLCDTNGGSFPNEVFEIVIRVKDSIQTPIGIHCHNDNGCGVANSIMAVNAGAVHVQGTYIGFGERCGNANLSTIIPSLQLKLGYYCIKEECMARITKTARFIAEIANVSLDKSLPYVGKSAFAHKGGMHVDGVGKNPISFEHIPPEIVGNQRNLLISEMAGRSAILSVIKEIDPTITKDSKEAKELIELLKGFEYKGYLFESASASLELLVRKHLKRFQPFFKLQRFKVIGEQTTSGQANLSSAMIKIQVGGQSELSAAEGEGPVHALDTALKKAVQHFYPTIKGMHLVDYKVRVMEPSDATAATVRVLISTTDGDDIWTTVGVSRDIIEASLNALIDSVEYKLMKEQM